MASVSSTSGANEYGWQQLKLQQARRNADQAEQVARSLKYEANAAQRVADRAEENARTLGVQSDNAQVKAGQARQGLAALSSEQLAGRLLSSRVDQVLGRQQAAAAAAPSTGVANASGSAVVNTQGQVTGTIINTQA